MAAAVGTSRQNIESLEAKGNRNPRYLPDLAKAMGVTTDDLHKGKYSAAALAPVAAPQAPVDINVNRRAPPDAVALLTGLCELLAGIEPDRATVIGLMLSNLAKRPNDPAAVQAIAMLLAPEAFAQEKQKFG